ncbi:MAG: hypothetical protein Q8N23_25440 [Archangium sp.]|nr:hypothetical protein [Archangium sp.]MDP3572630.1 hypothetical protein [Archangium sp.]
MQLSVAVHGPSGIEARPPPDELVALAREMPGNLDRLASYFEQHKPTMLFTLGAEAAAFVRGTTHSAIQRRVDEVLYSAPHSARVFGRDVTVVHLVHPHLFIKQNEKWMGRHRHWIEETAAADLPKQPPPVQFRPICCQHNLGDQKPVFTSRAGLDVSERPRRDVVERSSPLTEEFIEVLEEGVDVPRPAVNPRNEKRPVPQALSAHPRLPGKPRTKRIE